jgi:HYDIN/CFA65/VesB-like, Ig-like domain
VNRKGFKMRARVRRGLTPLFFILLVVLVVESATVNAQIGTSVSTARIDFGTVGRGGSAERDVILTNPGNNSTLTYSVNFINVTSTNGQLTATPSSGAIAPKSNVTVTVRLDVPGDANEGDFSSGMIVNSSTGQNAGGSSTVLPSLAAQVTYTVQGNAPAQTAPTDINVPLVAGVLGLFALIAIGGVYVILKKT